MKSLLSSLKLKALSHEEMKQVTGGADEICITTVVDTYFSNDAPPVRDEDYQCFPNY